MQNKLFFIFCLLLPVIAKTQTTFVFQNVNVVSMNSEKILSHQDVVIKNGVITSIQTSSKKSFKKAVVINASGKFLMPGLADMHVHLPRNEQYGYGLDQFMQLHLATGITTIRSMRGDAADPQLQRAINEEQRLGPNLIISAPAFSARYWIRSDSLTRLVHRYKTDGFQLLKILSIPSVEWFDTLSTIAQQEHIKIAGHAPSGMPLAQAFRQGLNCVEHLGGYETLPIDDPSFAETLHQTTVNKVFNCPTLDWYFVNYTQISLDSLKQRQGLDRLPTALVLNWSKTLENYLSNQAKKHPDSLRKEQVSERQYIVHKLDVLRRLYQNKCLLLISPDASTLFQVPGLSLFEEMKHYQAAGIPMFAILQAATVNAAAYMGESKKWGTVDVGKQANLLLLDKNPLASVENLYNPAGVMIRGRWLPTQELNTLIKTCKQRYHD